MVWRKRVFAPDAAAIDVFFRFMALERGCAGTSLDKPGHDDLYSPDFAQHGPATLLAFACRLDYHREQPAT
jgi:hypothetical protein